VALIWGNAPLLETLSADSPSCESGATLMLWFGFSSSKHPYIYTHIRTTYHRGQAYDGFWRDFMCSFVLLAPQILAPFFPSSVLIPCVFLICLCYNGSKQHENSKSKRDHVLSKFGSVASKWAFYTISLGYSCEIVMFMNQVPLYIYALHFPIIWGPMQEENNFDHSSHKSWWSPS
jgi:hypothetical protein